MCAERQTLLMDVRDVACAFVDGARDALRKQFVTPTAVFRPCGASWSGCPALDNLRAGRVPAACTSRHGPLTRSNRRPWRRAATPGGRLSGAFIARTVPSTVTRLPRAGAESSPSSISTSLGACGLGGGESEAVTVDGPTEVMRRSSRSTPLPNGGALPTASSYTCQTWKQTPS